MSYRVQLVFFSENKIISKAIQKVTNSKWSHVGFISHVDEDNNFIVTYEALSQGFVEKRYKLDEFIKRRNIREIEIKSLELNISYKLFKERLEAYRGKGYDRLAIFLILLFKPFLTIRKPLKRILKFDIAKLMFIFESSKRVICTEAVARILYELSEGIIDFGKEYNKPVDFLYPIELYNSLIWIQEDLKINISSK